MIKTQNLVPEVYYNRSRDFQLLGRIYDIIFNYLKTNIDTINNAPYSEDLDDKLVSLVSTTLGFKQTHEYNTEQLKALCSTFVKVLRNKGNLNSIQYLLNLLANVEANTDTYYWSVSEDNPYLLNIYLPLSLTDTSLFEDMLTYVLPAGMSYRIIKQLLLPVDTLEDIFYFGNDYGSISIRSNNQVAAGQLATLENMTKVVNNTREYDPSVVGFGRIEDAATVGETRVTEQRDMEELLTAQTETNYPAPGENEGD